jgi:hypothetical protein
MSWVTVGTFKLTQDWTFSLSVQGEIFRVAHSPVNNPENLYLKAVIASAFIDEYHEVNIFDPKRLTHREEKEVFTFYNPTVVSTNLIGLKRLDKNNIDWTINLEVYQADAQSDNFNNYLITRFGDIMDYIINRNSSGNSSVVPVSNNFNAKVASAEKMISTNSNRSYLIVRAGDKPVNLFAEKSSDGGGKTFIERINFGEVFCLPSGSGIYKGDIFVQAVGGDTTVSYTEYS